MKTFINLILTIFSLNLFSQAIPDYSLSAFGLSKDVIKCEENSYTYNAGTNSYDLDKVTTMSFQNGKLVSETVDNFGLIKYKMQKDYTYNAAGQIQKEISKTTYINSNPIEDIKTYTYSGNKLTSVFKDSYSKTNTIYFYNANGRLYKSETKKEDGKLEKIEEFTDVVDTKNYFKQTMHYNTDGVVSNNNSEIYVKGKYISFSSQSKELGNSYYEYTYDKYGNLLTEIEDLIETEKNTYEYDSNGNWITCKNYQDDWFSGVSDVYRFRKITLKNGSSGDTNFDQNFVNKYPSSVNKASLSTNTNPSTSVTTTNTTKKSATNPGCEGNCQDGYGVYYYADGSSYSGFFKESHRNGPGLYSYPDGSVYGGNWVYGKQEGFAYYSWKDGSFYIGYYQNDKINGEGIYMDKEKKIKGGIFKDGNFEQTLPLEDNGASTGCISGDCKNGFGKYIFVGGDIFVGFFKNGNLKHGAYIYSNKDTYMGEFLEGKKHGFGYYLWPDNNSYLGMYQNETYDGLGYYFDNTTKENDQIGEFRNGSLYKSMKN